MSHSIFTALMASIGAVAAITTHGRMCAEARRTAFVDPRDLPGHLRRDIGMADGQVLGAEGPNGRWTDYIQTRQAS